MNTYNILLVGTKGSGINSYIQSLGSSMCLLNQNILHFSKNHHNPHLIIVFIDALDSNWYNNGILLCQNMQKKFGNIKIFGVMNKLDTLSDHNWITNKSEGIATINIYDDICDALDNMSLNNLDKNIKFYPISVHKKLNLIKPIEVVGSMLNL